MGEETNRAQRLEDLVYDLELLIGDYIDITYAKDTEKAGRIEQEMADTLDQIKELI